MLTSRYTTCNTTYLLLHIHRLYNALLYGHVKLVQSQVARLLGRIRYYDCQFINFRIICLITWELNW